MCDGSIESIQFSMHLKQENYAFLEVTIATPQNLLHMNSLVTPNSMPIFSAFKRFLIIEIPNQCHMRHHNKCSF